ncbi:hypothetical protein J2Z79_000227 [Symbiobacterium terraclitae]|uniref:Uncharacterized protein n=1 Tax=Symbiobacterium terraclitae TaxID=557451 RepID=A0ABS4JMU2_9FIRM|nr:hypothetical protein [Symbiobacterium terraclitae]MBP2016854.1 hypothetical protein [Symbiobacterium terraclitae]
MPKTMMQGSQASTAWLPCIEPDGASEGTRSDWGPDNRGLSIEATLPDGSSLSLEVWNNELRLGDMRYRLPYHQGLYAYVEHLRLSAESLNQALREAAAVRLALVDLPGMERELTPEEREQLRQAVAGVLPASNAAGPQPLDPPFPQYAIRLEGVDWRATLRLRGDRYLRREGGSSAVHGGEVARLAAGLLPVPPLDPSDVAYLFLADRMEVDGKGDMTGWKNTVVRRLVGAQVIPGYHPLSVEPFTLTFRVNGEPLEVHVDAEGFIYRGVRYPGSGLTELFLLPKMP